MKELRELENEFAFALTYRSTWDAEWRNITDYLLPGRGIYQLYTTPQVRKLVSPKVINTTAREALQVLTSGFHGGLTSPSRPWFDLTFSDSRLKQVYALKVWLDACKRVLYSSFELSNFYQTIHSFYTEFGGFGTSAIYCGEDSQNPFRFELMTVGEYAFSLNTEGKIDKFFRVLYKTYRNLVEQFGDKVSDKVKRLADTSPDDYTTINQVVYPEVYQDKPFTSVYWETGSENILRRSGFYELPYLVGRWEIIGSDVYGLGLGSYALPDIKRLQEMEKSFLMGAHKAIDPPLNAPARKKGKVKSLPGGINYYSNPQEVVMPMQNLKYDYSGVLTAIERTENRIRSVFFNDLFLTATRDPNASPLKAAEVYERKEEKLLRIGPVIERLLHEFVSPLIERCFNIAARKGLLPPIAPEYIEMMQDYTIEFISPLAQSQKFIASQPINTFLQFVMGAAQVNPEVLDKVNTDSLVDEYADITGVPSIILRSDDEVTNIRNKRRAAQEAERRRAEAMVAQSQQLEAQKTQAEIAETYSEAGVNMDTVMPGAI